VILIASTNRRVLDPALLGRGDLIVVSSFPDLTCVDAKAFEVHTRKIRWARVDNSVIARARPALPARTSPIWLTKRHSMRAL